MSERSYSVGVVGAGVIAQQIAESLMTRAFPFSTLRFLGDSAILGEDIEVEGRRFDVEPLDERSRDLDVVFLTREAAWSDRDVELMILAGAAVIDCSGRYAREIDVPLVVPECNAEAVEEARERQIIASPDSVATALSVVLAPLHAEAGLRRVVATCLEAVSEAGQAGIDELSRQTIDLLQGRSSDPEVFSARVCFNVLPRMGDAGPSGDSLAEEQAAWQVRRILDQPELPISLSRVCVPLFFGSGIALNVELQTPMDASEAAEVLRGAPGVVATTAEEEETLSVGDAVGQDVTVVSRVRADRSADNALNLWVAYDNSRKGAAVNAVQIAELLVKYR